MYESRDLFRAGYKNSTRKNLYELGQVDLLADAMSEVFNDNLIYTHNNAHFRLVPNISSTGWLELDNELAYFKGSFMESRIEDNFLYLSGEKLSKISK